MKLIEQAILQRTEGAGGVRRYEVDLCQVGADQYVVNFRHGWLGKPLKEGSKTIVSVPLDEARRVYADLVRQQLRRGFQQGAEGDAIGDAPSIASAASATPSQPAAPKPPDQDRIEARAGEVIARLERGTKGKWPLQRAIWRAGELQLTPAEPTLLGLLRKSSVPLMRYSLVWALGRCGTASSVVQIKRVYDTAEQPALRRIAAEALRSLYDDEQRSAFVEALIDGLPGELAGLARTGPAAAFGEALQRKLDAGNEETFAALHSCYLIDSGHVRPAVLQLIRTAPMRLGYFAALRAIYKAAEYRRDAEVFGLLAYRFEKARANSWTDWREMHGGSWSWKRSATPFGRITRRYLRQRSWRTLRRLGELGDPDFVPMAVGVLLPFSDEDAGRVVERRYQVWGRGEHAICWDRFAGYWTFNQLLHGNSPRYRPGRYGRPFRCAGDYRPGDPPPTAREERFGELWQQQPGGLLHLLDESRCEPVHRFAVKVLADCTAFLDSVEIEAIGMLLSRAYEVTAELGLDVARRRYGDGDDEQRIALVTACADSTLQAAREQARSWIEADRQRFVADGALLASLVTSPHADTRAFARDLVRSALLDEQQARLLIGRVVATLQRLRADDGARAADIGQTLLRAFGAQMATIGIEVIRDLFGHPLREVVELAGEMLLNHAELATRAPDDLVVALLDSEHASARGIGARLLGQMSDGALLQRAELLVSLATHKLADLRASIRPVIARLARADSGFAREVTAKLVARMQRRAADGVHGDILSLLRDELADQLRRIPSDQVFRLLSAKSTGAQQLGGLLLADNVSPAELSTEQIVKLAGHQVLAVREAARTIFARELARLRQPDELPQAIRILDVDWDDTRQWAIGLVRERFGPADLTPKLLVSICDSARADVQQLGRELITRYFAEEHGDQYLLQLSEHPSAELQLFATNYLERYAAGHPERIAALRHYFLSVLSRVNRGRIAKSRCIAFLTAEARKDEAAARVVAEILTRQSATVCIGDRAAMIEAMVAIHAAHPSLREALPIEIQPAEVRGGV